MGKGRDRKKKRNSAKANPEITSGNKRARKSAADTDDDNELDELLADFSRKQAETTKVAQEENADAPSARSNASLVAHPSEDELILFGGEFYDGQSTCFFNDLYRFNVTKKSWRKVASPNAPPPRSSHQAVVMPSGHMYMFGGEFASTKETKFMHYRDFWRLDLKRCAWERLELQKVPSARSGHRMTSWKHFIVLFGGFIDTGRETKYLDDVWIFDTHEHSWEKLDFPSGHAQPSARSGVLLMPVEHGIVLYGGYSQSKTKSEATQGHVGEDMWQLCLNVEMEKIRWEKVKIPKSAPRSCSGRAVAMHKDRAIIYDGIIDEEIGDEFLKGTCCGDLSIYVPEKRMWLPVKAPYENRLAGSTAEVPCPRYNAMMAVIGRVLYIYGGIWEIGDRQYALDDLWSINVETMDKFECLRASTVNLESWVGEISGDDRMEEDDSDSSDYDSDGDDSDGDVDEDNSGYDSDDSESTIEQEQREASEEDPLHLESLKEYFGRTAQFWLNTVLERCSDKERRSRAFESAREHYEKCNEIEAAIKRL